MRGIRGALLAVGGAVLLSGCGTAFNLASEDPDNYGGVQRDLDLANRTGSLGNGGTGKEAVGRLALYGADVGLSFVGDTLTLPLAAYLRYRHEATLTNSTRTDG